MPELEGMLLVDKPGGPTSHDVVARIRRASGQRRVGHAGTLDPAASGLLPLLLGRATRLLRFLPHSPKRYVGTLRLGLTTTTDDLEGEPLTRHDGALPSGSRVLEAGAGLRGRSLQAPPAVSARKAGGQRLYRLARRGIHVEVEPRPIDVSRFDLEPSATGQPEEWRFLADVSAGTYIRSLVRDLGAALGCGAALVELRRTAIGPLRVEDAIAPDAGAAALAAAIVPPGSMPLWPPRLLLTSPERARDFCSGVVVPDEHAVAGFFAVSDGDGRLLGVGEGDNGRLRPRVVLA